MPLLVDDTLDRLHSKFLNRRVVEMRRRRATRVCRCAGGDACSVPACIRQSMHEEELNGCRLCGYNLTNVDGKCSACTDIMRSKQQLCCSVCNRTRCDLFCSWCSAAFHRSCAAKYNEKMADPEGSFTCQQCEGNPTDEGLSCGGCHLGFAQQDAPYSGLRLHQSILLEHADRLYNVKIVELGQGNNLVKVHYTGWSENLDVWVESNHSALNESIACDACNQWFHIDCLSPFSVMGRLKDRSYICGKCHLDAELAIPPAKRAYSVRLQRIVSNQTKMPSTTYQKKIVQENDVGNMRFQPSLH